MKKLTKDEDEKRTKFVEQLRAAQEKWAESEAGQAFDSWKAGFESIGLTEPDEIELDAFEIATPEFGGIDELEQAPSEAE